MQFFKAVQSFLTGFFQSSDRDWWVEIKTTEPRCTYYFGPFETADEAKTAHPGYVEDLQGEGAQEIAVEVKRCQPTTLTMCDDEFV